MVEQRSYCGGGAGEKACLSACVAVALAIIIINILAGLMSHLIREPKPSVPFLPT